MKVALPLLGHNIIHHFLQGYELIDTVPSATDIAIFYISQVCCEVGITLF